MHDLIREKQEVYRTMVEGKPVAFRCQTDPSVPDMLVGDRLALHQVLDNLLGNALKFTDSGSIDLLVAVVKRNDHNVLLSFSIADTGIGIPAHKMDKLFIYFRMVIKDFCKRKKLDLMIAVNGRQGLDLFRSKSFDLILMDIQLPGLNGVELTKIIREELHSSIPIIATTAFAMEGQKEMFLAAGMDDYIAKPMSLDMLYCKIHSLLNRRRKG